MLSSVCARTSVRIQVLFVIFIINNKLKNVCLKNGETQTILQILHVENMLLRTLHLFFHNLKASKNVLPTPVHTHCTITYIRCEDGWIPTL